MDVLVGSRDPILRRHIAYALGSGTGRIVTTGKGALVLIEVLDHDFDLVILDALLEGMDGSETLGVLRQMRPRVPVLFLHRAEDEVSDVVKKGGGRIGVLTRTADEAALMRSVEALISRGSWSETSASSAAKL